jgi:hypothetical protein
MAGMKKKPLETLKKKVSPGSTAGILRDRKSSLDARIAAAEGGAPMPKGKKK